MKGHIAGGRKMHQVDSAQTSYSLFRSRSVSRNFAPEGPSCHGRGASTQALAGGTATLAPGAGYLAVTALAAWVVVDRFGLGLLRKAWINLDVIWATALILTGCLTLFV